MGRFAEALADLDRAIALDEKYAGAIASRGETYRQLGRYAEALADFDRAIALDEKDAWAIASRGETNRQMGRYAEALADLTVADQLQADSNWTAYQIGLCHLASGRPEPASACFAMAIARAQAIVAKDPADTITRFNLALYFLAVGRPRKALRTYRETLASNPPLPRLRDALQDLTDLHAAMGELSGLRKARQIVEQAIQARPAA